MATSPRKSTPGSMVSPPNSMVDSDLSAKREYEEEHRDETVKNDSEVQDDQERRKLVSPTEDRLKKFKVTALEDGLSVAGNILSKGESTVVTRASTLDKEKNSWLEADQEDRFGRKLFKVEEV